MENNKLSYLNLMSFVLSAYVLIALIADSFFTLSPEVSKLLNFIDYGICLFFFIEFCVRFHEAENKWRFMRWGWLDLLCCIPTIDALRYGKLARFFKIFRILRAFKSSKMLIEYVFNDKKKGVLTTVATISFILLIFSSISILHFEKDAENANIKTAEDAIWWTYVTITTVGYGDRYPVTTEGRLIAAALMLAGVGVFGTFTGYVGSYFLQHKGDEK